MLWARMFISFEKFSKLPDTDIAAAFAASLPEHIIIPAARSSSFSVSPYSRYIELPSAVISSVNVTFLLPFAACSSVSSEVISFVVLAGFLCSSLFFERIILPF